MESTSYSQIVEIVFGGSLLLLIFLAIFAGILKLLMYIIKTIKGK